MTSSKASASGYSEHSKRRQSEKMLEAIKYLMANTTNCSEAKLLDMLSLMDTEHAAATGRRVTPLDYCKPETRLIVKQLAETLRDKGEPDASVFTPRELKIIDRLILKHGQAHCWSM